MLIAHVITRLLRAGSEENTLATCEAQLKAGHEVVLIHGRDHDDHLVREWAHRLQLISVGSLVRELNPVQDLLATRELAWIFRRVQPDLVHTHQSKAGILGRLAAKIEGVPNIVHGVHILPFVDVGATQKAFYITAERAMAAFTDAFIDVSGGMRGACVDNGVGHPRQHHIVHSGFDLAKFRFAQWPANWRSILDLGPNDEKPPIVVMLAALEPRKRHKELICAFGRVADRFPDIRLLLGGEGALRVELEREIAERALCDNVKLLGFVSNPEQLIALADVCLLTSMREGLPRAVVQYLAGGRPAVVTDVPGIEEVVRHGINGLITSKSDINSTIDALLDVLEDPRYLSRLRLGARRSDLSSWTVEAMCRNIEEVYHRIDPDFDGFARAQLSTIAA